MKGAAVLNAYGLATGDISMIRSRKFRTVEVPHFIDLSCTFLTLTVWFGSVRFGSAGFRSVPFGSVRLGSVRDNRKSYVSVGSYHPAKNSVWFRTNRIGPTEPREGAVHCPDSLTLSICLSDPMSSCSKWRRGPQKFKTTPLTWHGCSFGAYGAVGSFREAHGCLCRFSGLK